VGDGKISVSVSGGTPPYSFLWNDQLNQTNDTAFQLCGGYYCVTVTDAVGITAVHCDTVYNYKPPVSFPLSFPSMCENASPHALTGGIPAGGTYSGNGVQNTVFYPSLAGGGLHTVRYTVSSERGCQNSDSLQVEVFPVQDIVFPLVPALCLNSDSVNLGATIPVGGTFSGIGMNGSVFLPALAGVGNHQVTYSFTNQYDCFSTDSIVVQVNALPLLSFTPVDSICLTEEPIILNNCSPSGGTYWINGTSYTSFDPQMFGVGSIPALYVYQSPATSCIDTISFTIPVKSPPLVSITANPAIVCTGDYVNLKASGAKYYAWSNGNGWGNWHVVNPLETTVYTVTGSDVPGCWDTASVLVEVFQKPYVDLGPDIFDLFGSQVILEGPVGPYHYTWSDGSHLRTLVVDSSGYYSLKIEVEYFPNGSVLVCKDIDTVWVDLVGCVFLPNAFTPDGNGINDILYAKCGFLLASYSMAIYNRWGNQVFYTENIDEGWDGTYKGKMSPPDVYVCEVKYEPPHGQVCSTNLIRKTVTLVR
jgi:gliding motility-associated-like protein